MYYVQLTDRGRMREDNEDFLGTAPMSGGGRVFCVADGLGGLSYGEVASRIAVEEVLAQFRVRSRMAVERKIANAFQTAGQRIFEENRKLYPESMATTLTVFCLRGKNLLVGHIGDSRIYRVRGKVMEQLTRDHSASRNVLTRVVGLDPREAPDLSSLKTEAGDIYVQCSDGLYTMVHEDEMRRIVTDLDPDGAAKLLIRRANENGGLDNISLQIIRLKKRSK